MVLLQLMGPFADMRQRRFAVEIVNRKGRHKKDAALRHHVEELGLLVQVAAVLDRVDAGLDRDAQAASAERMAHDAAVEGMRLVGQRLHFVEIEGAVRRPVLGPRAGAAGRRAFDDVGPGAHHPSDDRTDIGEAVDDAVGEQRVVRHAARKSRGADAVADPADRRDDAQRNDEPRPRDQSFVDRPLEPGVEPGGVAHRGVAGFEGLLQHLGGAQCPGALRLVDAPAPRQIVAVHRHVVVAIDQPRQIASCRRHR